MSLHHIREKLPLQIAFKTKAASSGFTDIYNAYDVAIGGIPFMLKIDQNDPLLRTTAQFKKQQLDIGTEVGEQTLTGWWLRSQSSFHWGAGLKFGDPQQDDSSPYRFWESEGVNPWVPGQVTLLPTTAQIHVASGTVRMVSAIFGTQEVYYRADGANVFRGTASGVETNVLTAGGTVLDLTTDGFNVFAATLTAIYQINGDGSASAIKWNLAGTNGVAIGWTKQRMIACVDNKIYQPDFSTPTLPAALYSHPNPKWLWTDVDEGPEAIYVSGYVGNESIILRLTLDTTGSVPTLSQATVVADFPTGEIVQVMHGYLSTYLGIGTNKGIRIAVMQDTGSLTYGPLIPTPNPVTALRARDSHMLAGYSNGMDDGTSGVMRVELSTQLSSGRFPYCKDLRVHTTGNVNSLAILSITNKVLLGIEGKGVYKEHATNLETSGFLQASAQRYGTVWPKLFKRFNVRGDFAGPMTVSTVDDKGVETSIVSISENTDQTQDLAINYPDGPQEFLSLKFTLNIKPGDPTIGTTFRSYQLKALPGGPRPRQLTLPLMCYNYERDGDEVLRGYPGFALDRLDKVEALDSSGDVVLFEELRTNRSYLVTIEAIEFRQEVPRGKSDSKWGGTLTVVLRTLSA